MTDVFNQMIDSLLPNVPEVYSNSCTVSRGLAGGSESIPNSVHLSGSPSTVLLYSQGNEGSIRLGKYNSYSSRSLNSQRLQHRPETSRILDVITPATSTMSPRGLSATIPRRETTGLGPPSASQAMGLSTCEGGPPARTSCLARSVTPPPLRLTKGTAPTCQQQQFMQREDEPQLPSCGPSSVSQGRHPHVQFAQAHPPSAGRQRQQQHYHHDDQKEEKQHNLQVMGSNLAENTGFLEPGTNDGSPSECGGSTVAGCDDVQAWDDPCKLPCESVACSPLPMFGVHSLFSTSSLPAATPAAIETEAVARTSPTGTMTGDSSSNAGPLGDRHRNNSQVLLPPLLMRAAGQDGGEGQTVFFGPGALPGLLAGSSPQETGDGQGSQGPGMVQAAPMFLHVAPTAITRQQFTGMVPSSVPCIQNDDDESTSLWCAPTAAGPDGSLRDMPMPSGAGALTACTIFHAGGNNYGVGSNVSAAAAPITAGNCGASAVAMAAIAAGNPDPQLQFEGTSVENGGDSRMKQGGGSWLFWSNGFLKGGSQDNPSKATSQLLSHMPELSSPRELGSRADIATGAADAAQRKAVTLQQQQQQQQQQDDYHAAISNVSIAQLQPFNTSAQIALELENGPSNQTGAETAITALRSNGARIAAVNSDSCDLDEPVIIGHSELAAAVGGWLMSKDGYCRNSRRFCRTGPISAQGSRAGTAEGSRSNRQTALGIAAAGGQGMAHALEDGGCNGGSGHGSSAATNGARPISPVNGSVVAAYSSIPASPSGRSTSVRVQSKRPDFRPLSAGDIFGKEVTGGGGGGGSVTSAGAGEGIAGDVDSESGGVLEAPIVRWQRAARTAGLTASIARSFRTLRNQHDENLVREEQLQVLSEIGAGSFARVDKCLYTPPDGGKPFLVAVKRIKPEMLVANRDPEDLHLFIQEAQLLRKLNHPNIVKYIGLGVVVDEISMCGGGSGGIVEKPLGAEQLMELSRRSLGLPSARRLRAGGAMSRKSEKRHSSKRIQPCGDGGCRGGGWGTGDKSLQGSDDEGTHQPMSLPQPLLRGVFIVEEFLSGGTLKGAVYQQMLQPQKQLYSNATGLRWMAQVAGALSYMHTSRPKVLHRDIKLDNVLLQPAKGRDSFDGSYEGCTAKLGDLGLAALLAHHRRTSGLGASDLEIEELQLHPGRRMRSQSSCVVRQRVTAATQAPPHLRQANDAAQLSRMLESHKRDRLGTYMYMAPEVYQRQKYDEKCDCFSFAMLLYEVFHRYITACSLEHASQMEKYARQVSQGFRPAIHEDIPPPLRRVIKQCWAQDPDQRPDMAAVARELWSLEARGVMAELDHKQQQGSEMWVECCCIIS